MITTYNTIVNKRSFLLFGFSLFLLLESCSKEDEVISILNAHITQDSLNSTVNEGDPVVFNYTLSQALSEDLPLIANINRSTVDLPIDLDDFSAEIEYKGNTETEWRVATGNTLVFPKGNTNLKIRIQTFDDDRIEVQEKFYFSIEVDQEQFGLTNFEITNLDNLKPILAEVRDDDNFDIENEYVPFAFTVDDEYNFTLISASKTAPENPFTKLFFDKLVATKTLPSNMREDIVAVLTSGEQSYKITSFLLIVGGFGTLGAVGPDFKNPGAWELQLGYATAYPNALNDTYITPGVATNYQQYTQTEFENFLEEDYNSNGHWTYVLFHEYGHLATIAATSQWDSGYTFSNCPRLFAEGCAREDSFINQFNTTFNGSGADPVVGDEYVTPYAESYYVEDVAETFAFHIAQKEIPTLKEDGTSSTVLKKIHYTANHESFSDHNFREKLRARFVTPENGGDLLPSDGQHPAVLAFQNSKHLCTFKTEKERALLIKASQKK